MGCRGGSQRKLTSAENEHERSRVDFGRCEGRLIADGGGTSLRKPTTTAHGRFQWVVLVVAARCPVVSADGRVMLMRSHRLLLVHI